MIPKNCRDCRYYTTKNQGVDLHRCGETIIAVTMKGTPISSIVHEGCPLRQLDEAIERLTDLSGEMRSLTQ